MLGESGVCGEGQFQGWQCCHWDGAGFCSVDGKAMRLKIGCFVGWKSGWEKGSDVVWQRPSLGGSKIGYKDNKSGVSIWGLLSRCI